MNHAKAEPAFIHPSAFILHPSFGIWIIQPACGAGGGASEDWAAGDHVQFLVAHRLLDGVGGGIDGDLELLVPELGLVGFDLAVELAGLVRSEEHTSELQSR